MFGLNSAEKLLCLAIGLTLGLILCRWWSRRRRQRKLCEPVDVGSGGDAGSWEGHSTFHDQASNDEGDSN